MVKSEDLYIEILKYGKANIEGGITFSSLKEHLKNLGFAYKTEEDEKYWKFLFVEGFSETRCLNANPVANLDSEKYKLEEKPAYLDPDAYFRLLEHDELKQARSSSYAATCIAIAAIIISIIGAGFSIYYSKKQIDTSISTEDLKILEFDQVDLNSKLGTIIENQEVLIDFFKSTQTSE